MEHLSYEKSKKTVYRGLVLLAVVTLVEVFFSLLGKGHIISGAEDYRVLIWITALLILILSIYKAYFIIYEFMHMRYEVPGLVRSVLLPTILLIWAIIAFFYEGNDWNKRRTLIKEKNMEKIEESDATDPTGLDTRFLKDDDFQL